MSAGRCCLLAVWAVLAVGACGEQTGPRTDGPAGAGPGGGTAAAPYAGRNLILISLDTLRADATGFNGGPAGITEGLDALAAESVVFTEARAQAPQTAPSHMSLFTGVLPSIHGVQNVQHGSDPATGRSKALIESLPEAIPTLAEALHAAGYATVGLTDGGNLNPPHGFGRGFDEYTYDLSGAQAQALMATRRLGELRQGHKPFFLFVHTYEIHAPYVAPQEYLSRWASDEYTGPMRERVDQVSSLPFAQAFGSLRSLYWKDKETFGWPESAYLHGVYKAGVAHTDHLFQPFLQALAESGALQDSILVFLSDHGEEFFEHGQWQHDQLYEEHLRVPLFFRLPDGRGSGRRIDVPVALLDVMPTVLDLLGVERPAGSSLVPMRGVSLAGALLDGSEPRARPIVSEYRADRQGSPLYDWQVAIHHRGLKFIQDNYRQRLWWGQGKPPSEWRDHWLFDLKSDPGEKKSQARQGGAELTAFQGQLAAFIKEIEAVEGLRGMDAGAELDPEMREQLIQLGYIEDR